jgi:hypothetical protein
MNTKEKLESIYEGWKNLIFQNPEVEKEAKKRLEICVENKCCKLMFNNVCKLCGCPIPSKVRSPKEFCPIGKWEAFEIK